MTTWRRGGTPAGSGSPTGCRPGSRSRTAASSTPAAGRRHDGADDRAPWPSSGHVRTGGAARPATGTRAQGHRGPLRADHRRSHRPARTAAGQAPAVPAFRAPTVWTTLALTMRADGTSDFEVLGRAKFPSLGVRRRGQGRGQGRVGELQGLVPRRVRQAHPVGCARRVAGPRHGRDLRSSSRCRSRSCRAVSAPRSARSSREVPRPAGDPGDSLFLLLDGVLSVIIDDEAWPSSAPV